LGREKSLTYLCLCFSFTFFIVNIIYQYTLYGVDYPLDWDLPLYVYHANSIMKYGPISYMVKNNQIDLFYLILAFFGFLSSNTKLALIVLHTVSALAYIYLFSELAFTITKSHSTAGLTAILASLSTNILNLYGAPSQLFAYVLLLLVIKFLNYPKVFNSFRDLLKEKGILTIIFDSGDALWIRLLERLRKPVDYVGSRGAMLKKGDLEQILMSLGFQILKAVPITFMPLSTLQYVPIHLFRLVELFDKPIKRGRITFIASSKCSVLYRTNPLLEGE